MTLTPTASITLGNERFDSHILRVTAMLAPLPAIGSFSATFPAAVSISGSSGDEALLDLNGGEGSERVLTGVVRAIRRGTHRIEVIASDTSVALADLRAGTTYRNQGADDVVRALASDSDITINASDIGLPMAAFVADQRHTAAEHIARLASLGGAMARVNGDGELEVNRPAPSAEIALKYGREILTCDISASAPPNAQRIRTGAGPAGAATAPNALRPTKKPLPDGAAEPGARATWTPVAVLRTPAAAASAGAAADLEASASTTRVRATAFLCPKLRPGIVIEIQELPDGMPGGAWLLTRVNHVLDARIGGRTYFEGVAAAALDLSSLAGAALSAIGGLL